MINIAKFAKSKFFVPGFVIALVVIGWTIIFINQVFVFEKEPRQPVPATQSPIEDYKIIETPEGTFVENKKAGLVVKAPEGWEAKKIEILEEGSVVVQTSNVEGDERDGIVVPPLTKGCGVGISVIYEKMNLEEIKEKVRMLHWGLQIKSEEFEEIIINNYQALKNTFNSEILGSAMVIYIPKENKLYEFALYFAANEKERCIQEFEGFLETISIQ